MKIAPYVRTVKGLDNRGTLSQQAGKGEISSTTQSVFEKSLAVVRKSK
jgi:hypothetical protein